MDKVDPRCSCFHHFVAPVAIILIGLVFLLNALSFVSDLVASIVWPILLILAGLAKIAGKQCRCCAA